MSDWTSTEFRTTLNSLAQIDSGLPHEDDVDWTPEIPSYLPLQVWTVYNRAKELNLVCGVRDSSIAGFITVSIELPTLLGGTEQVSWTVPEGEVWDEHSRSDRAVRVAKFLNGGV